MGFLTSCSAVLLALAPIIHANPILERRYTSAPPPSATGVCTKPEIKFVTSILSKWPAEASSVCSKINSIPPPTTTTTTITTTKIVSTTSKCTITATTRVGASTTTTVVPTTSVSTSTTTYTVTVTVPIPVTQIVTTATVSSYTTFTNTDATTTTTTSLPTCGGTVSETDRNMYSQTCGLIPTYYTRYVLDTSINGSPTCRGFCQALGDQCNSYIYRNEGTAYCYVTSAVISYSNSVGCPAVTGGPSISVSYVAGGSRNPPCNQGPYAPSTTPVYTIATTAYPSPTQSPFALAKRDTNIAAKYPGCPKDFSSIALSFASTACSCFVTTKPASTCTATATATSTTTIKGTITASTQTLPSTTTVATVFSTIPSVSVVTAMTTVTVTQTTIVTGPTTTTTVPVTQTTNVPGTTVVVTVTGSPGPVPTLIVS